MSGEHTWIAAAAVGGALVVVAVLAIAGVFGGDDPEPATEDFGGITTPQQGRRPGSRR